MGSDGDRAHHLPVIEPLNLVGMTEDFRSDKGMEWGKGNWLHPAVHTNMEGAGWLSSQDASQVQRYH